MIPDVLDYIKQREKDFKLGRTERFTQTRVEEPNDELYIRESEERE